MRLMFIIVLLLLGTLVVDCALAQQPALQPDPVFLQKAVVAMQAQRNEATDKLAIEMAKNGMMEDRIKELEKQLAEARKPKEEPAK